MEHDLAQPTPPLAPDESNNGSSGEEEPVDTGNLLEQLRQERAESAEELKLIQVPGSTDTPLLIEYKMIDGHEIDRIAKRSRKISSLWERNFTIAIDVMIACAVGVYAKVDDETVPLTWQGEPILGYTEELASALNLKGADTARKIVLATFMNRDLYIANHSAQLQSWLGGANSDLDRMFLGE